MLHSYLPLDIVLRAFILSFIALAWVIIAVRFAGLRSFSKMTAFDFAVTVAVGSLLAGASTAAAWAEFAQSILAISALLAIQYFTARLRNSVEPFGNLIQNSPLLLMRDGEILHDALAAARVTEDDLIAKLREANVLDLTQVRAVVLETTGDISVIHGDQLQEDILQGVEAQ